MIFQHIKLEKIIILRSSFRCLGIVLNFFWTLYPWNIHLYGRVSLEEIDYNTFGNTYVYKTFVALSRAYANLKKGCTFVFVYYLCMYHTLWSYKRNCYNKTVSGKIEKRETQKEEWDMRVHICIRGRSRKCDTAEQYSFDSQPEKTYVLSIV